MRIIDNTFTPATLTPESGPYTYTITVQNTTGSSVAARVTCQSLPSTQLTCSDDTDADNFTLAASESRVVTVTYAAKGLGQFSHKYKAYKNGTASDSVTFSYLTVEGAPIQTNISPREMQQFQSGDSIRADFAHSSGVNSATFKLFMDGADVTSSATTGSTYIKWLNPTLSVGAHRMISYGCATNGRCDSLATNFSVPPAPISYSLDDSLPEATGGEGRSGLLPGALPLPPSNLRGCPTSQGYPDIRMNTPASYYPQGGSTPGNIFMAMIGWDNTLTITSLTIDHTSSDTWTCASSTWLEYTDYDWSFWLHTDPNDPLWETYDYGDGTPPGGGGGMAPLGGGSGGGSVNLHGRRPNPAPITTGKGGGRPGPMLPSAGAIDTSSYWVTLNGTYIIQDGHAVYSGVTRVSMGFTGSTFTMPANKAIVNRYDASAGSHSAGEGWNELIASIADSTGHRTSIRTRFIVVKGGAIAPIAMTPLRSFAQIDQGECAAFGAFQCGGVTLAQTIPGFVTRDRDRSLHLVYRSVSQRAPLALPFRIDIDRLNAAPDSLHAWLMEGGSSVSDSTTRYAGTKGPGGYALLDEFSNETRIVAGELNATPTAGEAIRRIQLNLQGFYTSSSATDTVSQDVVEVHWTDTTRTRFGAGWQLAEMSRLIFTTYQSQSVALWVKGDGSSTLFRYNGSAWVGPAGETARLVARDDSDSSAYAIEFPNGTAAGFTSSGFQRYSRDLVGNKTYYSYSDTRIQYITDPSGFRYEFTTDGNGRVSEVGGRNPGGTYSKLLTLVYNGSGQLSRMRQWKDGSNYDSTSFAYQASAPGAFLDSVIDPRGQLTTFSYDVRFFTPTGATTPPLHGTRLSMGFRDQWRRAAPRSGYGRAASQPLEWLRYPGQYVGTYVPVQGTASDYQVDAFGGPTYVRHFAPPPEGGFLVDADELRNIERDSTGRVTKIVAGRDYYGSNADSVMYEYDADGNLSRLIRTTLQFPTSGLVFDTTNYTYDSVATGLAFTSQFCVRMRTMRDAAGGIDSVSYGSSGVAKCLPTRMRGIAGDTTVFRYGSLSAGNTAGVRPTSTIGSTGVSDSVTYDATTWNTATHRRNTEAAASVFYDVLGRADSMVDPVGTPTVTRHDRLGRVYLSRTGTGVLAPVAYTHYLPGGLADSVVVYGVSGAVDAARPGSFQATRYFFSPLGMVDSTISAGGRRQWFWRDGLGNVYLEYRGNGSYISRTFDWQGRVSAEYVSQERPGYSVDGTSFADAGTTNAYNALGLQPGVTLHTGDMHRYAYDERGRLLSLVDSMATKQLTYRATGQLAGDAEIFADGATVTRSYTYNRRGQRTAVVDTARTSGGSFLGAGRTGYVWNGTTGRLDSLDATMDGGARIATTTWKYDLAGRDTLRTVVPWNGGSAGHAFATHFTYDGAGRLSKQYTASSDGTWYSWDATAGGAFNAIDELLSYTGVDVGTGNPSTPDAIGATFTYTTDGTRRLAHTVTSHTLGNAAEYVWTYDVYGNRLTEHCSSMCSNLSTYSYGTDNRLSYVVDSAGAGRPSTAYYTDNMGNRLLQVDSAYGAWVGPSALMSYTAKGQLFFSMTRTATVGSYDYNWHWYDGSGLRIVTHNVLGNSWTPGAAPTTGNRTYYVYDGADVAMMLVRNSGSWRVQSRFVTGGLDQPLAGWFESTTGSGPENLALVSDYQGSVREGVRANGARESGASTFGRNAFGSLEAASGTGGSYNLDAGFTGASTPNASGGFTYLRNRWYDPQTGRFLTQDPIGLAGGVNLYAYAGSNPIAFSDPFGLCPYELDGIPCEVYITAYGAAHGAKLSNLSPETTRDLWSLAQTSGHDIGLNATTNGTHDDPRHNGVSNCCSARNDARKSGHAVDIGEVDGRVVGTRGARGGVLDVQNAAMRASAVKAVIDPNGYWNTGSYGVPKQSESHPATVAAHSTHMHISFWGAWEGLPKKEE